MNDTQKKIVLLACFVVGIILLSIFSKQAQMEGFEDAVTEETDKKKFNPEVASHQLLTSVMGPIRRLSGIVLNPANWKERISMATMSPTELARMHLKSQQTDST